MKDNLCQTDISNAIESMSLNSISNMINDLFWGLYSKENTLKYLQQAFQKFESLGNTCLKVHKQFSLIIPEINSENNASTFRFKFKGNKTNNYLALFFKMENGLLVNVYDVLNGTKSNGLQAIDNNQVLVFPKIEK